MKNTVLVLFTAFALTACGGKQQSTENSSETVSIAEGQTAVIYFHTKHRCATCMAVESVTREALTAYGGRVPFYSVDMAAPENKALMKKYQIGNQSLVVVRNDKKEDLTGEAFMFARSKPEKVKKLLQTTINSL